MKPARRTRHRDPTIGRPRSQKEELDGPAGWLTRHHAGRQHAAAVGDQQVSGAKERWQVAEEVMLQRAPGAIQHEETGLVPFGRRLLGNELRWEVVVEVVSAERHAANSNERHKAAPYNRNREESAWISLSSAVAESGLASPILRTGVITSP